MNVPHFKNLIFPLLFVTTVFANTFIFDFSEYKGDIDECLNFILDNREKSFFLILPQNISMTEKRMLWVISRKYNFKIIEKLNPCNWLRGVSNLNVSDIEDVFMKNIRKLSQAEQLPEVAFFIGKQIPDQGALDKIGYLNIDRIFCVWKASCVYSHENLKIVVAKEIDTIPQADGIYYVKVETIEKMHKFLEIPNLTVSLKDTGKYPEAGIILSGTNLKLWEMFAQARKRIEEYKNSGRVKREKLIKALELSYQLENLKNWQKQSFAVDIFKKIVEIYDLVGKGDVKISASKVSDIIFEEKKKTPLSVLESGIKYTVKTETGYLLFKIEPEVVLSSQTPVEIYWWNPQYFKTTEKLLDGKAGEFLSNFCISAGEKSYFYIATDDGWQRLWTFFSTDFSTKEVVVKFPLSNFVTGKENVIQFFIRISNTLTSAIPLELPQRGIISKFFDPVGDAKGPGWWDLPEDFPQGCGDIMTLTIWKKGKNTNLQFYFAGPLYNEKWFCAFDLYIDINGIKRKGNGRLRKGLNCWVADDAYWEMVLSVEKEKAILKNLSEVEVPMRIDAKKRIVSVFLNEKVFPYDIEKCALTFVSFLVDEKGKVVEILEEKTEKNPGGGRKGLKVPNVLDVILPGVVEQKRVLSTYLKKRMVVIPPIE
ncbi:MAG: hypothetical protein J7L42_02420 [Elusimicrobia bacterium]|nr:hypothetical protein [Elusimicrobiota bacterium]